MREDRSSMNFDRGPVPPIDYGPDDFLADRRKAIRGPVPVSFAFMTGLALGMLIMIPIWTAVTLLAFFLF